MTLKNILAGSNANGVFGDAISGVKATVAAGALCIGIQSPYTAVPLLEVSAQAVVCRFPLSLKGTNLRLPASCRWRR